MVKAGVVERLVLRRDGAAPGARPPAERAATTARRRPARRCSPTASGPRRSNSDPAVIGKTIRLGPRTATVVGVLEPSVPYPADTEIIANVVTSPHHLGATMVTERTHRMTELFGRLAPGATLEAARAELTAVHAAMMREHPEAYSSKAASQLTRHAAARSDRRAGADDPARAARRRRRRVRHRLLERRQPDPGAIGAPRRRARGARGARRRHRRAAADAARREPRALRRAARCSASLLAQPFVAAGRRAMPHASRSARSTSRVDASVLWVGAGAGDGRGRPARLRAAAAVDARARRPRPGHRRRPDHAGHQPPAADVRDARRSRSRSCCSPAPACCSTTLVALQTREHRLRHAAGAGASTSRRRRPASAAPKVARRSTRKRRGASAQLPGVEGAAVGSFVPWRDAGTFGAGVRFARRRLHAGRRRRGSARADSASVAPRFFSVLGVPLLAGRDFTDDDRARQRAGRRSSARAWRSGCSRTATR